LRLRQEDSIIKQWQYTDKVYVSIICMTFNQESYIKKTIEGFLMQNTDFKFEILIHDDASTDSTPQIINEYAEKYPDLIKIIQQSENQYSQKPTLPTYITIGAAAGKYMAICEGDDYWSATNKIQRQVELLEQYSQINLCYHECDRLQDNKLIKASIAKCAIFKKHSITSFAKVVKGGGAFISTPSIVMRSSAVKELPDFFLASPVGDYVLQVLSAAPNGAIKINEAMAVYRIASQGSWSSEQVNYSPQRNTTMLTSMVNTIKNLDLYYAGLHKVAFDNALANECTVFAFKALKANDLTQFRTLIDKSWNHKKWASFKQSILFMVKKYPMIFMMYKTYLKVKL